MDRTDKLLDMFDVLEPDDLQGEARELADLVGMDTFRTIVEVYGGSDPYIPKMESLLTPLRNKLIRMEYNNGSDAFDLSRKWGLSERWIRRIVSAGSCGSADEYNDDQTSLFDK